MTAYGLARITARLQKTVFRVIGITLLLLNLSGRYGQLLPYFLFVVPYFFGVVE